MDKETIQKVALLARLHLSEEEVSVLQKDIGNILEYADQLASLPTDSTEPLAHPGDIVNALRDDKQRPSTDREDLLRNAPKTDGQYYLVPAVLGESGKS